MRFAPLLAATALLSACAAGGPPPAPRGPLAVGPQPTTLDGQLAAVRQAVAKYGSFAVAEREGWTAFGGDEALMGIHYHNDAAPDYVSGDPLDFSRPNNLMYTDIDGQKVLTGVAYVMRIGEGERPPEGFAGSSDRWHVHDFVGAIEAATEERPVLGWIANWWLDQNYRNRGDNRGRLAMAHVWVAMPNPDGVFADFNRTVPYKKLGLPDSYWRGASVAAARGLNLGTNNGCSYLDGTLWIATARTEQERDIKAACERSGEAVRRAVAAGGKERVNRAGERAWADFDAVWQRVLTPAQKARVAAMSEHGSDGHADGEGHMEPGAMDHGDMDHSGHGG